MVRGKGMEGEEDGRYLGEEKRGGGRGLQI